MRLERVLSAIYGNAWAIMPDMLDTIMQISLRENEGPEALSARLGRPLQNTRTVTVQNGVAVIPITGPIIPRANTLEDISGATSLQILAKDLYTVLEDDSVHSILLDIDSPGGAASGIGEFSEDVRAANKIKPVTAYVSGYAASAAYWIASAAGEIVAHKTASLGSIGVVTARYVQEGLNQDGYKEFEIVSSSAIHKRPDPRTEHGMAEIIRQIDSLEGQFIDAVASYRSVSAAKVRAEFGQGGMLIASEAIKAGMADRLGSYEETLSGLTQSNRKGDTIMTQPKAGAEGAPVVTAASIRENHPDVAEAIKKDGYDSGFKAGAEAERSRIAAIDELARAGNQDMIAAAKADGKSTAADVAIAMVKQDNAAGANHLNVIAQEAAQAPVVKPAVDPAGVSDAPSADLPVEDRARAEWNKMDEKARGGYGGKLGIFTSAMKAKEAGFGRSK